jgi:hypothetical protein
MMKMVAEVGWTYFIIKWIKCLKKNPVVKSEYIHWNKILN